MTQDNEEIIKLQEKVAWLESELEKQSNLLNGLYERFEIMQKDLAFLKTKVLDPYATCDEKDEVPPPHY